MATKKLSLNVLIKKREKLISKVPELDKIIIGNLQKNLYFPCGAKKCKCKDKKNPVLHGPVTHISIRCLGKVSNFYLKNELVKEMELYINNYKKFWQLISEIASLNFKISKLQNDNLKLVKI
ncbi:MAG TPA: hypothetical protein PK333_04415 [Candidatus Moranbacteria bacterium]|nr:hypothetical protein [Candidatus Moranbacteria bacterium]